MIEKEMAESEPASIAMVETNAYARKHESGWWEDEHGMIGPYKPGVGPRKNPANVFPTGPEVGQRLPDIVALAHDGTVVDVHEARAGRPAVVVFYRSAVW